MAKGSADIIVTMEEWFNKAPSLPTNAKEVIVKITPILSLVFGILGILGALGGLGALTAFSPFAMMGGYGYYGGGFIAAAIWLVSSVLLLMSYPDTKNRKLKGWNMLFWSEVVNLVGSLVAMSIVSGIIGALIGFYLLFQIKSYYK